MRMMITGIISYNFLSFYECEQNPSRDLNPKVSLLFTTYRIFNLSTVKAFSMINEKKCIQVSSYSDFLGKSNSKML